MNNIKPSRKNILVEQLVLVDGQPACGKGTLYPAVASMDRVELLNFSFNLENICGLRYLDKIDDDSSEAMIKLELDLVLYETMMGRNTNFRFTDRSSAFNDVNLLVYLKRLCQRGDKVIPDRIKKEKPILHFMTHSLLGISKPIFNCYKEKLVIIELVRHPKAMLEQQTAYNESWFSTEGKKRQFRLFVDFEGVEIPFWTKGWEKLYVNSNPVERAIYEMDHHMKLTEIFKSQNNLLYDSQCISIPFENFVVDPWPYIEKITRILKTETGNKTKKIFARENIPRRKQEINENEIRKFLYQKNASKNSIDLLECITNKYEEMHLK